MNRVLFAIVVGLLLAIGFNQSNDYSSPTEESSETNE